MPSETILRTKLFAPLPRRSMVERPRLLDKLTEAEQSDTRLLLVCAPAGFGKTTVVAEWIISTVLSQAPTGKQAAGAAWLTLDEADNDPVRFWRYIDAALQNIDPRLGENIRPALYAPQPPPYRALLAELVNDILTVDRDFILVLDDFHVIQNESIFEAVNYLIDHLPPLVHLLIATRSDPPLQLARRRARGELFELRAADLRFTNDEAAQFINEVMRLGLSAEDVAALEARTEGWITGLQMAAISLQDTADPHAFVTAFRGNDRYIADYLLEEVLQRQPVEFQQFMLQTSVLNRLCGPLCDAVTGRGDSQAVLNSLERANLFIAPLDNHREWFRYHHLFASLLQQRLLDTADPASVLDLKRRASQWHADHGNVVDAVEIALSCGNYEQAIGIVEVSDVPLFMGDELNTLRQWTERIPADIISAHPRLNLMATWASHATGHPQQAERFVQLLEQSIGVTIDEFLGDAPASRKLSAVERSSLLEGAAVRARIAADSLDLQKTFTLSEKLLPHLKNVPGEPFAFNPPENLLGPTLFVLGLAYKLEGNLTDAARFLIEAEADGVVRKNQHIIALAIGHLGEVQAMQGKPEQARATFERAIETAKAYPRRSTAFWSLAYAGLGELAYEQGDYEKAERHFQSGFELGRIWNSWECLLPGMRGLARIQAARGEWQAAYATLDDLLERTAANALMVCPAVDAERAAFQLQQGDLDAAARWAAAFDAVHPATYRLQWEQSALVAARIWLAQGRQSEAQSLLAGLLSEADAAGRLQIAQRIRQILTEALPAKAQKKKSASLVEPLSEREIEVLRLMAEGLSNPEIARKLYLSPNTLKAHAQNIYRKLDAHNRMDAVNKARELDLL